LTGIGIEPDGKTFARFYNRGSGIPGINYLPAPAGSAKADYEQKDISGYALTVSHNLAFLFIFTSHFYKT
jgi:hypothetical protein